MKKHFVTFFSPGSFIAEQTEKPIEAWDVSVAVALAKQIVVRYGATPFAFRFTTRSRGPDDLDSKVTDRSCYYYLGGKIITLAELKQKNDPRDKTLIRNMECNGWDRVVENNNSYRWTQELCKGDVVLDVDIRLSKEKRK